LGSLPFIAADPMEWVHCHIARKPVPPNERLATVPAAVSNLASPKLDAVRFAVLQTQV
jgi:hypothetical protein